jgi:hypothetical protein
MGLVSEIRDPEKPVLDPGSRGLKAPDPGSGSALCGFMTFWGGSGSGSADPYL